MVGIKQRFRGRQSNLRLVYNKTRESFENWRLAGHYVDRGDLLFEFLDQCNKRLSTWRAVLSPNFADIRELRAIESRVQKRIRAPKVDEYTTKYMLKEWGARLLRPQRLVSIDAKEDERRCLGTWGLFDWVMRLAAFEPENTLGEEVRDPEAFRKKTCRH